MTTIEAIDAYVAALIKKAEGAQDAGDAMRFTQAAVNAANAFSVIAYMPKPKHDASWKAAPDGTGTGSPTA